MSTQPGDSEPNEAAVSSVGPPTGQGLAIQIVSFDWPWPANYGGAIDVAHKIEALLKQGVDVVLHVIAYPRKHAEAAPTGYPGALTVFNYERRGRASLLSRQPFIVASRKAPRLLPTLASGPEVILFEGIHTTACLGHPRLAGHHQWVRVHNREQAYYEGLARSTKNLLNRGYFTLEARKLAAYEAKALASADHVFCISQQDLPWATRHAPQRVSLLTPFTATGSLATKVTSKLYVLFHAAFDVADNEAAALRMIERVGRHGGLHLVLAGRRPGPRLLDAVSSNTGVTLKANPGSDEMLALIAGADAVLLDSSNPAGFKLKLLESLRSARHVIATPPVLAGAVDLARAAEQIGLLKECQTEKEWQDALERISSAPDAAGVTKAERERLLQPYGSDQLVRVLIDKLKESTFTRN